MFYFPPEIWMLILPVAIIWILVKVAKGAGNIFSADSSQLDGAQSIRLRNMSSGNFRNRVLYAYRITDSGVYIARVKCDILKESEGVEATSKEELEAKVDEVYERFNQMYKEWRHKKIYGK